MTVFHSHVTDPQIPAHSWNAWTDAILNVVSAICLFFTPRPHNDNP